MAVEFPADLRAALDEASYLCEGTVAEWRLAYPEWRSLNEQGAPDDKLWVGFYRCKGCGEWLATLTRIDASFSDQPVAESFALRDSLRNAQLSFCQHPCGVDAFDETKDGWPIGPKDPIPEEVRYPLGRDCLAS